MKNLRVSIDKWVNADFPGWVECSFTDAFGETHKFREKVPIVTSDDISESSKLPVAGSLRCKLGAISPGGPDAMVVVDTYSIDGVESLDGRSEFTVKFDQIYTANNEKSNKRIT